MLTSASSEADSGGLELNDCLEKLEGVGGEGCDGTGDERNSGCLEVGGFPVSAIRSGKGIHNLYKPQLTLRQQLIPGFCISPLK